MSRILGLLFLVSVVIASENQLRKRRDEKQCYGDLGCFVSKDFTYYGRKSPSFPWSRDDINANFILYRKNRTPDSGDKKKIKVNDDQSVRNANFDSSKAIKILVHGFQGAGNNTWLNGVAKSFLSKEDINVIAVDWSGGSGNIFQYSSATANTWVVGGEIWLLCKYLVEKFNASYDKIHIIGHSLGAHTAGYAGSRMKGQLGRITGLDPAEPNFEYAPINMRLDPTDAKFVDVIHTDASSYAKLYGYGLNQSVGHLDFYPNGGEDQPGCKKKRQLRSHPIKRGKIGCHHSRAPQLFDASITTTCPFIGHRCSSYKSFINGYCNSCGTNEENCARMGYHANKHPNANGTTGRKFYLITSDSHPYCLYHYSFELVLRSGVESYFYIQVVFYGTKKTHSISWIWLEQKGSHSIKQVVGVPNDLGIVNKVEIRTDAYWNTWKYPYKSLPVKNIIVEPIDIINKSERKTATTTLCYKNQEDIQQDKLYTFKSSNCK